ncbi:MAG TPA: hypothetical protein DCG53_02405 [Syntrophus sp. (in: bacteria)]|nr:hypothetical protein [Syntrophus sp. (in: bacteria)]
MANPTGSGYLFQNAVLREISRPSSERAQVSIEAPATDYAEGKSISDAQALSTSTDLNFKKAALAESGRQSDLKTGESARQFGLKTGETDRQFNLKTGENERQLLENLLFAHDQLGTLSQQNDLATIIGVGNIALTGAQAYKTSETLKKQEEMTNAIIDTQKKLPETISLANLARTAEYKTFLDNLKATNADPNAEIARDAASAYIPFSDDEIQAYLDETANASLPSGKPYQTLLRR